jgi:hypothetical protein
MGFMETDNLQRTNQTESVVNINISDEPPLSIAESAGQTLALSTVSASSLPNPDKGGSVTVDISNFTATKILDERSSSSGAVMLMDWIWINMDQHPPNLTRYRLISININQYPFSSTY